MVDYCPTDIANNPQCSHGPSLLFCRKGSTRKFYTCSAFRCRKQCPFFQWKNDIKKGSQQTTLALQRDDPCRINYIKQLPVKERCWCHTCEMLFHASKKLKHKEHNIEISLTDDALSQPSLLFKPKEESKGESQYFFSDATVNTVIGFLKDLKVTGVLCLGCPRLHEYLSKSHTIKSMLLDIDSRYLQFYDPDRFQLFNMFNCHIFDPNGWPYVKNLLSCNKIAIIADPPFGGRTEPLAYTFERLKKFTNSEVLEFLILPYFMEPFVISSFPHFNMLDYKIVYINHRKFKKHDRSTGSSKSAVRIFTNVDPSFFKLPSDDYKYCSLCNRWVCNENQHCFVCNMCTSKNGAIYKHCKLCGKCVKNTWQHCSLCGICKLVDHRCVSAQHPPQIISQNGPKKRKNKSSKRKNETKKFKKNNCHDYR